MINQHQKHSPETAASSLPDSQHKAFLHPHRSWRPVCWLAIRSDTTQRRASSHCCSTDPPWLATSYNKQTTLDNLKSRRHKRLELRGTQTPRAGRELMPSETSRTITETSIQFPASRWCWAKTSRTRTTDLPAGLARQRARPVQKRQNQFSTWGSSR